MNAADGTRGRRWKLLLVGFLAAVAVPGTALAAPGKLTQLPGPDGCVVNSAKSKSSCAKVRALDGPGPFLGSRAIALSPDGDNVYVAASKSDAIAIFDRNAKRGTLSQPPGAAGCVAADGAEGCAAAVGLDTPNSVAVSPDGRNVYATSKKSGSITTFDRDPSTGALSQPAGRGCLATKPLPGCKPARALRGADVLVVSPDGENVYVGAFFGNAVATFTRNPTTGALTQPAGAGGCIAETTSQGCAQGLALGAPEGLAISGDGAHVYVAGALSSSVVSLSRDATTGYLSEALDGSDCISNAAQAGCAQGIQVKGANAVAVSPDDSNAYVTSLFSNSVTSFTSGSAPPLLQNPGTTGCLVYLVAVGCSLGHALEAPEGVVVSPDGANVYAAAFESGAVAVLDRDADGGGVMQKAGKRGCLTRGSIADCKQARALRGASSLALSPDGRFLYVTAWGSDAVAVFARQTG
jgi:DNA-binding beta-propeller fold protein YncE